MAAIAPSVERFPRLLMRDMTSDRFRFENTSKEALQV